MIDKKGFVSKRHHPRIFLEGLRSWSLPHVQQEGLVTRDDSVDREKSIVNTLEEAWKQNHGDDGQALYSRIREETG
jgi:hypothetical protein